jgi:hypothetical protein
MVLRQEHERQMQRFREERERAAHALEEERQKRLRLLQEKTLVGKWWDSLRNSPIMDNNGEIYWMQYIYRYDY